jgi:hypothetical protein
MRHSGGRVAQLGEHLLCKQGVAGSIPATSTNPFDCQGFTELVPHPILAAVHEVCKIALIVATVHNHSETKIAENTEHLSHIGIAGNGGPMLKKQVRSSCQELQEFRAFQPAYWQATVEVLGGVF